MVSRLSDEGGDVEAQYRELKSWAEKNCTHEQLAHLFAKARIEADLYKAKANLYCELRSRIEPIQVEIAALRMKQEKKVELNYQTIAVQATEQGVNLGAQIVTKRKQAEAHKRGKNAANILHSKPGGSRSKVHEIRLIWASGRYSDRDLCATQECDALEMAWSTARRALRNTPDPIRNSEKKA